MFYRSPPQLRSGSKGQSVPLATDKTISVSSQSDSSSSSACTTSTVMPDNTKQVIDPAVIAACVDKYLAGSDVTERLVSRITQELRSVVEEAVKAALTTINSEIGKLRKEVERLSVTVKDLDKKLDDRTDELEQYQRRNNLRFFGIEESEREDTDVVITQLCREKLGVTLPPEAICRTHRVGKLSGLGPSGEKRPRPIIIRFTSYRFRREVYSAKKKMKGTGITIREDLTARRLEVLRRVTSIFGTRSTWTQDGRVLWIDGDGRKGVATRFGDIPQSK